VIQVAKSSSGAKCEEMSGRSRERRVGAGGDFEEGWDVVCVLGWSGFVE